MVDKTAPAVDKTPSFVNRPPRFCQPPAPLLSTNRPAAGPQRQTAQRETYKTKAEKPRNSCVDSACRVKHERACSHTLCQASQCQDGGHAYAFIYINNYPHTLAYMHTCIHAHMHTCIHTYIHTYIRPHTYTNACINRTNDTRAAGQPARRELPQRSREQSQNLTIDRRTA